MDALPYRMEVGMHVKAMITKFSVKQSANSEIRNVLYPILEIETMVVRDKHTCR
jgi:hypothetical protein